MTRFLIVAVCVSALLAGGCVESAPEKKAGNSVLNKTTDKIEKFDPNAKQEVSDQKIRATDPITAPLTAYGPTMEKISIIAIDQAVGLFYATEGRYPKDYDEFMEKIVRANNIKLPVLPYGGKYQYNEADHNLVIVRPPAGEKKGEGEKPAE